MSVPKDSRREGELAINVAARSICTHVLSITGNEKNFPKEQEWFCLQLRNTALTATGKVLMQIRPSNVKAERKKLARLVRKCLNGEKPRSCADNSYKAWRTHAAKGNSYKLIRRMDDYYRSLWAEGVFK